MASIYRPTAKQTQWSDKLAVAIESILPLSINRGVVSQSWSSPRPHQSSLPVKDVDL
jgi:hypothetical protein